MYTKAGIFSIVMSAVIFFNMPSHSIDAATKRPSVIFIHHSVGESLINDGSIRQILTEAGFNFWDHDYNNPERGLRNEKGEPAGCYWIPENNTDPDGFASLFSLDPKKENAFSKILKNHDIIVMKSCFPNSQIQENNILKDSVNPKRRSFYNYKRHYLSMRDTVDKYPEKIFIIVTQPPIHPNDTNEAEAKRAKAFVEWLTSKEFLGDRKNLFVFDYFSLLADQRTGMLRTVYQLDPQGKDSHPNAIAQMLVGPHFADFVINAVRYRSNVNSPEITFDNPGWPAKLVRVPGQTVTVSGKISSSAGLKKITWTDLKGHGGELAPGKSWIIHNIPLDLGITKIIVSAINDTGLRSSSVIGLQHYSGKAQQAVIFDGSSKQGILDGISYVDEKTSGGKKRLVIQGTGRPQRVAINKIRLDVSDFDPEFTFLEMYYDQGTDTYNTILSLLGIGSYVFEDDGKSYPKKIIIPFNKYTYIRNILDSVVFRGVWKKNTTIYIDSIRLVSSGNKK